MPSTHNINPAAAWTTPLPVPDDGARITADAGGINDGPVNPAFSILFARDRAITLGIVSLAAIYVDGGGEAAVVPTPGNIETDAGDIIASGGNVTAAQQVTAGNDVVAGRSCFANQFGVSEMKGRGVLWTDVDTVGTADEGNPPTNTPLLNDLRPLNTCKAWARVITDGLGSFTLEDACNIDGVSLQAPDVIRFLFAENMSAADKYSVTLAGAARPAAGDPEAHFYIDEGDMLSDRFDVHCGRFNATVGAVVGAGPDVTITLGTVIDPATKIVNLMVQVFGRQTS